ncbi:NAD(P)H dehydrogenase [quinone] 1-like [Pyxicephalus adspersus]|uniref:NAD(P)H dehydrogenase [quinone] 1-like n=1 Tax=Pyxicephalus adspersus TaxID=30357 RepID=UPI003B58C095
MAGKTALIVLAHQERTSFNFAMKEAAACALKRKGWKVLESDLYAMNFNAVLSRDDITGTFISLYYLFIMLYAITGVVKVEKKANGMRISCFFMYYLQNKKALLSFTTGAPPSMTSNSGLNGDINVILWPMQNGILNFCGFQVLEPQISYAVAHIPQEARVGILKNWEKRLEAIWDEKPIKFLPIQDFEGPTGGFVLKKEVEETLSESKYAPTVGQNLGKPLPPDSQVKSEGTRL